MPERMYVAVSHVEVRDGRERLGQPLLSVYLRPMHFEVPGVLLLTLDEAREHHELLGRIISDAEKDSQPVES